MALTPADFAAYSRATGVPYPESPEERAQMVPEVRAFRAGQLKQGESGGENNLLTGIGIGLGLLGAAGVGGLALRGRLPKQDTSGKSRVQQRTNPPADQVKDVRPSKVATEPQPDNFTETLGNFVSDIEAGRNPQRDGDFPGTATRGSGFQQFSKRADDISEQVRSRQAPEPTDFLEQFSDELEGLGLDRITVGKSGEMLAGPEVAAEARQMMGTESSRQSAVVSRLEKEEESLAKNILSELAQETLSQADSEKAARIARNRQQDVARAAGMISDAINTEIEEGFSVPNKILKLADRASAGTVNQQDVNTFRNWMQGAYKNDPTVLREMNEELSSVFPQQQSTLVTSQENRLPIVQEQATDALASTDDNVVNRVRLDAQRNEDLDLATGTEYPAIAALEGFVPCASSGMSTSVLSFPLSL